MPALVGTCWANDAWSDDAWASDTWAASEEVVAQVQRRMTHASPLLTICEGCLRFMGLEEAFA